MTPPKKPGHQPYWLWKTKRMFPHPLFAGCISVACLLAGILSVVLAFFGCLPMLIPGFLFFAGFSFTATAALTGTDKASDATWLRTVPTSKPTYAIIVLLIGMYSTASILAIRVFDEFFRNGPRSTKFSVTLGILILATVFMRVYGKRVVRQQFGGSDGKNWELDGRQATYVVLFLVGFGIYFAWLTS